MVEKRMEDGTKAVIETKQTAIESNYTIEAINGYTAEMLDIFYLCLSATRPRLTEKSKYHDESGDVKIIPDAVIQREMEKKRISATSFRKNCKALASLVINFADKDDNFDFRPAFNRINYIKGVGLRFQWNPVSEEYILYVEKNYSEIVCRYIYKTGRDKWAKRIIEQISRWGYDYKHGKEYEYAELRNVFGLKKNEFAGEKGKKNFALKLRRAAKNITDNTPYNVSITTAKKDPFHPRQVSHYYLHWEAAKIIDAQATEPPTEVPSTPQEHAETPTRPEQPTTQQTPPEADTAVTAAEQSVVDRMANKPYRLARQVAVDFVKQKGIAYCQEQMQYVKDSPSVKNAGGLLKRALECDYAGSGKLDVEIDKREKELAAEKARHAKEAHEAMQQVFSKLGRRGNDVEVSTDDILGSGYDVTHQREYDGAFIAKLGISVGDARRFVAVGLDGLAKSQREAFAAAGWTQQDVADVIRKIDEYQAKN